MCQQPFASFSVNFVLLTHCSSFDFLPKPCEQWPPYDVLVMTAFGQTAFGQTFFGRVQLGVCSSFFCACLTFLLAAPSDRLSAGPPSLGPPKISHFFAPLNFRSFSLSLWGSSRGILVVFSSAGTLKCVVLFFSCLW